MNKETDEAHSCHQEKEAKPIKYDDIQKVFSFIDVNKDGSLSREEMREAFQQVPGVDLERINQLIEKCDKDGNGDIDLEELVETCMFDSTVENSNMLMKLINHNVEVIKKNEEKRKDEEYKTVPSERLETRTDQVEL